MSPHSEWQETPPLFWGVGHAQVVCGILVPRPGIEPVPPVVEAWSLNHWTAREVQE